jgi:hypothetical protein
MVGCTERGDGVGFRRGDGRRKRWVTRGVMGGEEEKEGYVGGIDGWEK